MKPTYKPTVIFLIALTLALCATTEALCQLEWTKYEGNPVMVSDPDSWEGLGILARSIIYQEGTYKMWYYGGWTGLSYPKLYIGYATSLDGITWEKSESNPVLTTGTPGSWEEHAVGGPSVIFDGTLYHMWYFGVNNNLKAEIGYATSLDGVTWDKYEGNPVLKLGPPDSWDSMRLIMSTVVLVDSVFHMWYIGLKSDNSRRIGYATSQDGKEWTKYSNNPVLELGESGSWDNAKQFSAFVIMEGSTFKMFYDASDGTNRRIGLAESEDGVNWTKYEGNPILDIGTQGTWDREDIGNPLVTFNGSNYSMLYNGNLSTGLATCTPLQHDIKVISTPTSLSSIPILINKEITPQVKTDNVGLMDEMNIPVTCIIDSAGVVVYSDTRTIDTLVSQDMKCTTVKFNMWMRKDTSTYSYDIYYITQLPNDENTDNDTLKTTIAISNLIDDFELGLTNWHSDTCWGLSVASAHSGTNSLCNTTSGGYENNLDSWVECNYSFDLSQIEAAHISLWTKHLIEKDRDFGYLELSTNNGNTWSQVGDPFTGINAQWTKSEISLTDFCEPEFNDVRIRFHFVSDSTQPYSMFGWFIDDVAIYPYELETSVSHLKEKYLPQKYMLFHNYPNPFNPETKIKYILPQRSKVILKIYNILGKEIRTLIDEVKPSGSFEALWDSKDDAGLKVTSGIYLYRIQAENFTSTRKMILMK